MKRSKAGVYVIVLQAAVLLAGLFAAASTAPDEKAKSQQHDPDNLTHSLNGAESTVPIAAAATDYKAKATARSRRR